MEEKFQLFKIQIRFIIMILIKMNGRKLLIQRIRKRQKKLILMLPLCIRRVHQCYYLEDLLIVRIKLIIRIQLLLII